MIELRDYQPASIDGLRQGIREGRRAQVLCIPTGGGKTVVASYLLREAHGKGTRAAMVVFWVRTFFLMSAISIRLSMSLRTGMRIGKRSVA